MAENRELACAFGEPWLGQHLGHCPLCTAYAQELQRQFEESVTQGVFDRDGYTPADRRRAQTRQMRLLAAGD